MLAMAGCFLVATALAGLLIRDPPRAESALGQGRKA